MTRLLAFALLCLATLVATAQTNTPDSTTVKRLSDGMRWHDLPPPMNIVNGGYLLEHHATTQRDARWLRLGALAIGGVLWTQNNTVGYVVAGGGIGYSVVLNARGNHSERKAAQLFQMGYNVTNNYDIVPDSIDAHPHLRVVPR